MKTLVIPGRAVPQGSMKAYPVKRKEGGVGVNVVHDSEKLGAWRKWIRICWRDLFGRAANPATGPIQLHVDFEFRRPKKRARPKRGGEAKRLKTRAIKMKTTRPDLGKLARAVEDALTGLAWKDDAQIVCEELRKFYGIKDRVTIRIWEFGPQGPA